MTEYELLNKTTEETTEGKENSILTLNTELNQRSKCVLNVQR